MPALRVSGSLEFKRILSLPRRKLDIERAEDLTHYFRAPGGTMSLWPIQSAALMEASLADGLYAMMPVGSGKTLVTLLLPEVLDSKKAVLLVPTQLKKKTAREIPGYQEHFNLPLDRLAVVTYDELSSPGKADVLEQELPDLIICDESDQIARKSSARSKRLFKYNDDHPGTRFCMLTGTPSDGSILDYVHHLELTLRKNSPAPRGYNEVADWANALDAEPAMYTHPGALMRFCEPEENVREGFRRRVAETTGVLMAPEVALGLPLKTRKLDMQIPSIVHQMLEEVRRDWAIAGQELTLAIDRMRFLKQLACGFYYRWKWPDGVPDYEWLEARNAWNREVREKLKRPRPGMDSPYFLERAAQSGKWKSESYANWSEVKDRPVPPNEAIWISDFLIKEVEKWIDDRSIIWYGWIAVGERLAEDLKLPLYGEGTDADIARETCIVCSMKTQSTGKNLQDRYDRNLLTSPPVSARRLEQLIGRTHRYGQKSEVVKLDWYGHTPEYEQSMAKARGRAKFVRETQSQEQKILSAE